MSKQKKKGWAAALEELREMRSEPIYMSKSDVERLQQAFPWADPSTLAWLSHALQGVAAKMVEVAQQKVPARFLKFQSLASLEDEKYQAQEVTLHDLTNDVCEGLLEYVMDDMELIVGRIEEHFPIVEAPKDPAPPE